MTKQTFRGSATAILACLTLAACASAGDEDEPIEMQPLEEERSSGDSEGENDGAE